MSFNYNITNLQNNLNELEKLYSQVAQCEDTYSMETAIEESGLCENGLLRYRNDQDMLSCLENRAVTLISNLNNLFETHKTPESQKIFSQMEGTVQNIENERQRILEKLQTRKNQTQRYTITRWVRGENPETTRLQQVEPHFSSEVKSQYNDPSISLRESITFKSCRFFKRRMDRIYGVENHSRSPSPENSKQAQEELELLSSSKFSKKILQSSEQNLQYFLETKEAMLTSLKDSLEDIFQKAIRKGKKQEDALLAVQSYASRLNILSNIHTIRIEEGELITDEIQVVNQAVKDLITQEQGSLSSSWGEHEEGWTMPLFLSQGPIKAKIHKKLEEDFQEALEKMGKKDFPTFLQSFYESELPSLREHILELDLPEDLNYELMSGGIEETIEKFLLKRLPKYIPGGDYQAQIYQAKCQTALKIIIALEGKNDPISKVSRRYARSMINNIPIENFPFEILLFYANNLLISQDPITKSFVRNIVKDKMNLLYRETQKAKTKGNEYRLLKLSEKFVYVSSILTPNLQTDLFPTPEERYLQAANEIEMEELAWETSLKVPPSKLKRSENRPVQSNRIQFMESLQEHQKLSLQAALQKFKNDDIGKKGSMKILLIDLVKSEAQYIREFQRISPSPLSCSDVFLIQNCAEYFAEEIQKHFSLPSYFLDEILDDAVLNMLSEQFQPNLTDHEEIKTNLQIASRSKKALELAISEENRIPKASTPSFLQAVSQCIENRCRLERKLETNRQIRNIERYKNYQEHLQKMRKSFEMSPEKNEALENEMHATANRTAFSHKTQRRAMEQAENIYRGKKSLSKEEARNLLLFQKACEGKQITQDENEQLVAFYHYITGNKEFNQRIGALLKKSPTSFQELFEEEDMELFKYGISNKILTTIRYLSFKMRGIEEFKRCLKKAEMIQLRLLQGEEIQSEEKLSFKEFQNILSIKKVVNHLKKIDESGFRSKELDELKELSNRSEAVAQAIENEFQQDLKQVTKSGDILMDSNERKANFMSSKRKWTDVAWDIPFKYTHAGLAVEGEEQIFTSEIYQRHVNDDIYIEDFLKKRLFRLNLQNLQFNQEFLKAFQDKYREQWKEKIQEDFEHCIETLNSSQENQGQVFKNLSNSWDAQKFAGMAKLSTNFLNFIPYGSKMAAKLELSLHNCQQKTPNDFKAIEKQMLEFREMQENSDGNYNYMFCSEFVARITISAFVMMQEKYKEEFQLKEGEEAFKMPFPKRRNVKTVDPGSLIEIFDEKDLIQELGDPPFIRKVFKEPSLETRFLSKEKA